MRSFHRLSEQEDFDNMRGNFALDDGFDGLVDKIKDTKALLRTLQSKHRALTGRDYI